MAKNYQVLSPLVIVKSAEDGTLHHLYQGATVSRDQVDAEQFDQLLESEMIGSEDDLVEAQAVEGNDPNRPPGVAPQDVNPEGEPPAEEEEEPSRVDDIVAAVGDDKEAARAALEKEQATDSPRSTLVKKLEAIIEA